MSDPEKTLAFVLRVVDFSESSSIVTLFTRDFGKLSGLAKGARKPKGPFESALDLLSYSRVVFLRKASGNLELLTEAKLERRFRPRAGELTRLNAGYYVAELLTNLSQEHDPHPELFSIADQTLWQLSQGAHGQPAEWILRFELALLREIGQLPALLQCAACGEPIAATPRVTFGLLDGGLLCVNCRVGKRQLVMLPHDVPFVLQEFAESSLQPWERDQALPTLPSVCWGPLRGWMNHYLQNLLGSRPRLHDYLSHVTH